MWFYYVFKLIYIYIHVKNELQLQSNQLQVKWLSKPQNWFDDYQNYKNDL